MEYADGGLCFYYGEKTHIIHQMVQESLVLYNISAFRYFWQSFFDYSLILTSRMETYPPQQSYKLRRNEQKKATSSALTKSYTTVRCGCFLYLNYLFLKCKFYSHFCNFFTIIGNSVRLIIIQSVPVKTYA